MASSKWIITQIGAREHYAVARALERRGKLGALVTDAWVAPSSQQAFMPARLRQRYHDELSEARIIHFTPSCVTFEAKNRLRGRTGWDLIQSRNSWFEGKAAEALRKSDFPPGSILFSYSYAALEILQVAAERGWRTVLGQIDPGIEEEKIVASLFRHTGRTEWTPAPEDYWDRWQEECRVADVVVANSAWAKDALGKAGVPSDKMRIVPLAYAAPEASLGFARHYPPAFDDARPLSILFLGQTILRKGVIELLDAARQLEKLPVRFVIVGNGEIVPCRQPNIEWRGAAVRSEVDGYYKAADVFLFPTHSDGFGLTQLEAQSWRLPIIASRRCGEVVQHDVNGWLLEDVSAEEIAAAVRACLDDPARLQRWSDASQVGEEYSLEAVGDALLALESDH